MSQQRRHEAPELGAMIRRMVRSLVRRAAEGDTEALEQLAQLEAELPTATTCAMALMNHAEDQRTYYSYGELANVLGVSRQAVRQRTTRVLVTDDVAAYYSDDASRSVSWRRAQ